MIKMVSHISEWLEEDKGFNAYVVLIQRYWLNTKQMVKNQQSHKMNQMQMHNRKKTWPACIYLQM